MNDNVFFMAFSFDGNGYALFATIIQENKQEIKHKCTDKTNKETNGNTANSTRQNGVSINIALAKKYPFCDGMPSYVVYIFSATFAESAKNRTKSMIEPQTGYLKKG